MFTLSCYIGPRFKGTRLYIKANYNTHSPLKVCWELSKHWRLLQLVGKVFILTTHIVVMHMLAANVLFTKNLHFLGCRGGKVSSNKMTIPLPSGCVVQHQSKCVCCYSIVQQKLCIHISNIRCTKSHNSNVSCLVLHLSLSNPLKKCVKSRMKM